MTRSVKDLRELICVSRLSIRDSDEEDDLSRPLSSLSMYGERSSELINGNGDFQQKTVFRGVNASTQKASGGFAVPKPPSSRKGSRPKSSQRPQSAQSESLSSSSSFNFRKAMAPLPPVVGRPSSSSSSGSDLSGSGEAPSLKCNIDFDKILQYIHEETVTAWLQRATDMVNDLSLWCNNPHSFVDFAQFWLTEFPESQRLEIYKLEISIIVDELMVAFGDAYIQGKVRPSDLNEIITAVLKEYPVKLCSARGSHVFLDILDTLTSHKTQAYKSLLTDVKVSTRNATHAQWMLALRAFCLLSVWSSIVSFYRQVNTRGTCATADSAGSGKRSSIGNAEQIVQQQLFLAVRKGYVSVIYYFLKSGKAKPDIRDDQGKTLTFAAVLANQSRALHYLITKHKDVLPVNQPGDSGNTPLHTAASWNYIECIQVLLEKGHADVNVQNPECDNATPLHVAVMQGHLEACEALVAAGANTQACMNGITPLNLARDMGHDDIAQLLLSRTWQQESDKAMDISDVPNDAQ